jgi:hypothetical protein
LAAHLGLREVLGEGDRQLDHGADLGAAQGRLPGLRIDALGRRAGLDAHALALGQHRASGGQGQLANAQAVDRQAAIPGGLRIGLLQAHVLEGLLDLALRQGRALGLDLDPAQLAQGEFRLERQLEAVAEVAAPGGLVDVDARMHRGLELLLLQGLLVGAAQEVLDRVAAHRVADHLLDHRGRHLARSEALDAHLAAGGIQPLAIAGFEFLGGHVETHFGLARAELRDLDLHG